MALIKERTSGLDSLKRKLKIFYRQFNIEFKHEGKRSGRGSRKGIHHEKVTESKVYPSVGAGFSRESWN